MSHGVESYGAKALTRGLSSIQTSIRLPNLAR